MRTTVFDVAAAVLSRFERDSVSPLKLQKLVYYTFGWYAHLTGSRLFDESIYAMEHGPVVGSLLSAHRGRRSVTKTELAEGRDITRLDAYTDAVVEAVMASYGNLTPGQLVDKTHEEPVWIRNWAQRTGMRADIPHEEIIESFQERTRGFGEVETRLPDPRVVAVDGHVFADLLSDRPGQVRGSFVAAILSEETALAS